MAAAPLGSERERETEEGESSGESEGGRGGVWRLQGVVEASREAGGGRSREEVAGARGRARRARARPPGREEDDRGGVEMGWAGGVGPSRWASVSAR